jgi:hypothetical protein
MIAGAHISLLGSSPILVEQYYLSEPVTRLS